MDRKCVIIHSGQMDMEPWNLMWDVQKHDNELYAYQLMCPSLTLRLHWKHLFFESAVHHSYLVTPCLQVQALCFICNWTCLWSLHNRLVVGSHCATCLVSILGWRFFYICIAFQTVGLKNTLLNIFNRFFFYMVPVTTMWKGSTVMRHLQRIITLLSMDVFSLFQLMAFVSQHMWCMVESHGSH